MERKVCRKSTSKCQNKCLTAVPAVAFMGRISFTLFNDMHYRCLDFLLESSNSCPESTDNYKNVPYDLLDFESGQFQTVFPADQKDILMHPYSHEDTKENGSSFFLIKLGKCFQKREFFPFFCLSSL